MLILAPLDTIEGRILIANEITMAVARKAAEDLGTKKLGPVFKHRAVAVEKPGFAEFLNFTCILYSRSLNWASELDKIIRAADRNSYYLYAMLRGLLGFLSTEMGTAGDREKAERLVALIRSKREFKKKSPGERAVNKMLGYIKKTDAEKS